MHQEKVAEPLEPPVSWDSEASDAGMASPVIDEAERVGPKKDQRRESRAGMAVRNQHQRSCPKPSELAPKLQGLCLGPLEELLLEVLQGLGFWVLWGLVLG